MGEPHKRGLATAAMLLVGGFAAFGARAGEFNVGDVSVAVHGVIGAGTAVRTQSPDPALIPQANGAAAGVVGTAFGGRNQDDGNLNFRRGDAVSSVFKGLIDVEAKYGAFGIRLSGMAWRDMTLADGDRPWGNLPNNLTPGIPLGEASNSAYGRFAGFALLDANLYGTVEVAGRPLHARIGNQLLPWGVPSTIGGLSLLNATNLPATFRPGALPQETVIPMPAAFARFGLTPSINVEGFYQFAFQRSETAGCGTFFAVTDYIADRCDKIMLGPTLNDRQSLALGAYAKQAPDQDVSDVGQFGAGVTYKAEAIATQFGAYFAQYHSRSPFVDAIRAGRPVPFILGDPDGLNPRYFIEHPEDIRVFAGNAVTRLAGLSLFAEIAHRPNQPVQLNSVDVTNAFVSPTAPSPLRAEVDAVPFGGTYRAFDRLATTDVLLGAGQVFPGILGAATFSLGGEIGGKFVHDLPDVTVRRYGRSEVFGGGPVNGVCVPPTTVVACSNDGFVTAAAFGARARATLTYANFLADTDVTPSIAYGYDLQGWSYDAVFNEGRQFAILSLRAEYQKRFAAEIAYVPTWGGTYNNGRDRDVLTLAISAKF